MVYIKPEEVIDEFYDNIYQTTDSVVLASSAEDNVEITMHDANGIPHVIVSMDNALIDAEFLDEPDKAAEIVESMYSYYIDGIQPAINTHSQEDEENDEIEEREADLSDAAAYLLSVVMESTTAEAEKYKDRVADIVDVVCNMLYKDYSLEIYRPMILEDDSGAEFFERYPYGKYEPD